jgi:hypothetical protein
VFNSDTICEVGAQTSALYMSYKIIVFLFFSDVQQDEPFSSFLCRHLRVIGEWGSD